MPDGFTSGYFFNCDYASPLPDGRGNQHAVLGIKLTAHKAAALDAEVLSTLYSSHSFKLNGDGTTWNGQWWQSESPVRENHAVRL